MINTEWCQDIGYANYISDREPYPFSSFSGRGVALLDIGVHTIYGIYDVVSSVLVHVAKTVHQVARTMWCSQTRSNEWALCKQHAISIITQPLKAFAARVGMIAVNVLGLLVPEWGRVGRCSYGLFLSPQGFPPSDIGGQGMLRANWQQIRDCLRTRSADEKKAFLAGLDYLRSSEGQAVEYNNAVECVDWVIALGKNPETSARSDSPLGNAELSHAHSESVPAGAVTRSDAPPRIAERGLSALHPVPDGAPHTRGAVSSQNTELNLDNVLDEVLDALDEEQKAEEQTVMEQLSSMLGFLPPNERASVKQFWDTVRAEGAISDEAVSRLPSELQEGLKEMGFAAQSTGGSTPESATNRVRALQEEAEQKFNCLSFEDKRRVQSVEDAMKHLSPQAQDALRAATKAREETEQAEVECYLRTKSLEEQRYFIKGRLTMNLRRMPEPTFQTLQESVDAVIEIGRREQST